MATFYSNPVLREREAVNVIAAATTLTADDVGVHILDAAAGATVTLPSLPTDGKELYFKFIVGAVFATTPWIIDSAEGDNINGGVADMGTTVAAVLAAGEDQVNFVESAESLGDWVELISDSGNSQWILNGVCFANGGITVTDPS